MKNRLRPSARGFTLVELMVVIVIMGIMASLVLLNINGVDHRKALQAREVLILDLQRILREANDQAKVLALDVHPETDVLPFRYQVKHYIPLSQRQDSSQALLSFNQNNHIWQDYAEFKRRELPEKVSFQLQSLEYRYERADNSELLGNNAPELIWLGNGEVKPVRIQFYFDGREIGQPLEIDHLGKVIDES